MTEKDPSSILKSSRLKAAQQDPYAACAGDPRELTTLWRARSASLAHALGGASISREMLATVLRYDAEFRELFCSAEAIATRLEKPPEWVQQFNELRPSLSTRALPSSLKLDEATPPEAARRIAENQPIGECLQAFLDAEDEVFLEVFAPCHPAGKGGAWTRLVAASACARRVETDLRRALIGQPEAVAALGRLAFRIAMGATTQGPAGIALFLGPPGVGKTLAAQTFATALSSQFGHVRKKAATLTVDGTQYTQWSQANSLIGTECEGTITRFVREHPDGTVIVNEFEKAHRKALESFLPVLDHGVQVVRSQTVDFSKAVFIFTTNLGAELWDRPTSSVPEAFHIDPMDLLSLATKPDRDEDWWATAIPSELLSRLGKGEIVLFRRPQGHHALRKLMDGLSSQRLPPPPAVPDSPDDEEDCE